MKGWTKTRREFLKVSSAALAGAILPPRQAHGLSQDILRFGIISDPHYADADPRDGRFYRESIAKITECVELMNSEKAAFLVELGDFKDQDEPPVEERTLSHLGEIEAALQRFDGPTYHVLGNHDMDSISKAQFLERVVNTGIEPNRSYYSFAHGGLRFVVLDANFMADGAPYDHGNFDYRDTNLPPQQLDWLAEVLAATPMPTIVFCHQRLDGEGPAFVNNADEARLLMRRRGNVVAVFHGHDHAGGYNEIDGIHYYTLRAVVAGSGPENNSYAIVDVTNEGLTITGYRRALNRELDRT